MEVSLLVIFNNSCEAEGSALLAHHDALAREATSGLIESTVRLSQQAPAVAERALLKIAIPAKHTGTYLKGLQVIT